MRPPTARSRSIASAAANTCRSARPWARAIAQRVGVAGAIVALAGCGVTPSQPLSSADSSAQACGALFDRVDTAVDAADVRDAGAARIDGFPWLRVTRPLASFRDEVDDRDRFAAWVDRLAAADQSARRHELANLSQDTRARLRGQWAPAAARHDLPAGLAEGLSACRAPLRNEALGNPDARERLRSAATAPDAYNTWQRVLGFYPISWRVARPRVEAYQAERAEAFESAVTDTPDLRRYATPVEMPREPARLAREMARDGLGIPAPDAGTRAQLLAAHAPQWAVTTASDADRPGALTLDGQGRPTVRTDKPVEYRRLSWTRMGGEVLLQLTYQLWFPERPADGWFDIYAGHLDGILWRVTLGTDGEPIAYDSIHPCGCYYTLFPTEGWSVADVRDDAEPVASPAEPPALADDERMIVGLEPGTHYLAGLDTVERPAGGERLAPLQLQRLRSLALPDGGRASAFAEDGLIPSSARSERLFLWPLGVPSAGAMRQWGTHAIAFIGRRHFDDPYLLERLLVRDTDDRAEAHYGTIRFTDER